MSDEVSLGICAACRKWQENVWLRCAALSIKDQVPDDVLRMWEHDVLRHCFILTIDAAEAAKPRRPA